METLVLIILGIVALVIAFFLIKFLIRGAILLFEMAAEQAFIGIAIYFACWIIPPMTFLMVIGSIIVGAVAWWGDR